jgi:hypothetical protein
MRIDVDHLSSTNIHVWREKGGVTTSRVREAVRFSFNGRENVPETECLISSTCDNTLTVGAHRKIEDSVGVSCESRYFLHRRVLPDYYLIQRIPMGAHDLVCILWEHQIANLRPCVNTTNWLKGVSVPESDASIRCASSRCKKTVLVRTPADCFNCCSMIREFYKGLFPTLKAPYHQFVIITSGS